MSGIQKDILYHAMRIQTQFEDDLGNPIKLVSGSGFCVLHKKQVCFITNKHNLDPKLKLGENTSYKLKNVSIEYRIVINPQMLGSETAFCEINNFNSKIVFSEEADVAVIKIDPIVIINGRQYGCKFLSVMEMANQDFLSRKVSPMDVASFIGFPGNPLTPWWDTKVNYGIARVVNIASFPHESFSNPAIKTKDVTLVNGLSFGGSSGSMVILHKKGLKVGGDVLIETPDFADPKVIGIMSGHWWDHAEVPEMFRHSGISYFTRSTSILEVLNKI